MKEKSTNSTVLNHKNHTNQINHSADNNGNDMSKGWEIKMLGDIASFSQGIQVGLEKHELKPKPGYVRFIRIIDYTQNTDDIRYIPNPGEKYFVKKDDIVMVRYGTPGLIGRGKEGVIANNLFKIAVTEKNLCNDYLVLYLSQEHIQSFLSTQGSATMPALNFGQLKNIEISYPSLPEQKHIVAILDEAFAVIDKAKANAEKNLQNAKELFESYLQNVFANPGEDWEEKRLMDVCTLITDGTHFSPKNTSQGEYKYITAKNIKPYHLDLSNISYITAKDHKEIYARCPVKKGDVLYIKDGATAGVATLSTLDEEFSLLSSVALLKPSSLFLNTFLVHYMNSAWGKKNFLGYIDGAAITRLTLIKIKNVIVPVPPIKTQKEIVNRVDLLAIETKKLETIYQQKLNDLEELKKSILQKAFSGSLNYDLYDSGDSHDGVSKKVSKSLQS